MQDLRKGRLSEIDVFEANADFTVASHNCVLIAVWRTQPTVEAFRRIDSYTSQFAESRKSNIAILIVIETTSDKPPSKEARQENVRLSRKYESIISANATVLEGTSVKHSMFRFIISTIQLMSPSRIPHSTFESVSDAASWIAKTQEGINGLRLAAAVNEARKIAPPEEVFDRRTPGLSSRG